MKELDGLSECDETNIVTTGKRNKQQFNTQAIRSLKDQLLSLNEKLENHIRIRALLIKLPGRLAKSNQN